MYLKPGRELGFEALSYVSTEGRLSSYSNLEFDGFIERLKNKSLPNSLIEMCERAVSPVGCSDRRKKILIKMIACFDLGINPRKRKKKQRSKKSILSFSIRKNLQEYKKYRLIEDYDFGRDGKIPHQTSLVRNRKRKEGIASAGLEK